ncbi:TPA: ABC transporter ATP-binding protein, partial [Candidatus Acetothermia bacterium]|nr:ABC transporter ATP-binding protein [Candidatus Acetothermia bacterium]
MSPSYYTEHPTGDLMAHATNDIEAVRRACSMGVLMTSDAVIMISFSLVFMIGISPSLTLWALIPLPFISLVVMGFGRLIHRRFERVQAVFSVLTERVREVLSGIRLLRGFAREEGIERAFAGTNQDNVNANISLIQVWGVFEPSVGLFAGTGAAIILWMGGRAVLGGTLDLGGLVAITSYLGMLVWPMMAIGWIVNTLQQGSASMKRLEKIFAERPTIASPPDPRPIPASRRIEIRNLVFSYPGLDRPALRDVNLTLEEGTTLGIVGLTGSGKSTLVRLLPRLYDPPPGTVFLGGTDVRALDLTKLRAQIGMVPQDVFLFSASLRDNIAFGRPDASEDEVWEVARLAGLAPEVAAFP